MSDKKNGGPKVECGQAALIYGNKVISFGGRDGYDKVSNDIYEYNIEERKWTEIIPNTEDRPKERSNSIMVLYKDRYLIMHGGRDGIKMYKDMWKYDLEENKWKKIWYSKYNNPKERSDHSAIIYEGSRMIIFGGTNKRGICNEMWEFDLEMEEWCEIFCIGDIPSPRYNAHMGTEGKKIVLFSGYKFGEYGVNVFGDIYEYDFETEMWERHDENKEYITVVAACMTNNKIYVRENNESAEIEVYDIISKKWGAIESSKNNEIKNVVISLMYGGRIIYYESNEYNNVIHEYMLENDKEK